MPDAERKSETIVEEDYFFYRNIYRRIETTSIVYMKSSEALEIRDARIEIKWYRVAGIFIMLVGLVVLLAYLLQ